MLLTVFLQMLFHWISWSLKVRCKINICIYIVKTMFILSKPECAYFITNFLFKVYLYKTILTLNLHPASLKEQFMTETVQWSFRWMSNSSRARRFVSHRLGQATGTRPHFMWCAANVSATKSFEQYLHPRRRFEHSPTLCWLIWRRCIFIPHLFSQYMGS